MTDIVVLSEAQLHELTGRDRPRWQARILCELGIPFRTHPVSGRLLVSPKAVEAALGVSSSITRLDATPVSSPDEFQVNIEGVRAHGKAAAAPQSK